MRYANCIKCGEDFWGREEPVYCKIHSYPHTSTTLPSKPSAEPPTSGLPETPPSKRPDVDMAYMSARAAAQSPASEIPNLTTYSPSSELKGHNNLLESMRVGSLWKLEDGKSSASPVTSSSQPKKMSDVGTKHDQDKPALAFIPKAALYAEGEAFAYGAKKYEAWNYKNGIVVTRTLGAALRHISQFLAGEDVDADSGANHLGCARANLAMALDTLENHPEMDDRFKGGKK